MATGPLHEATRQVERLFTTGGVAGLSEQQLVDRFVARRDEAAFEALVARHGPMVLGVCRRLLRDPNDVEDAFQATFLVLVRKAGTLRRRELLGNWLYGVASRVALRARAVAVRRTARESAGVDALAAVEGNALEAELHGWLHDEIGRLPAKYRTPVVLCYLEGLTHDEAAARLGWPAGTVKGRLARARDLLRTRLARRGLTSAGAVALLAELPRDALAAVPAPLFASTLRLAAGTLAGPVLTLTEGAINAMFVPKLKVAGAVALVAAGLVTSSAVLRAYQDAAQPRPTATRPETPAEPEPFPNIGKGAPQSDEAKNLTLIPPNPVAEELVVELPAANAAMPRADDRPEGPVAAEDVRNAEKATFDLLLLDPRHLQTMEGLTALHDWSQRVVQNHFDVTQDPRARLAALAAHRDRMRELVKRVEPIMNQPFQLATARTYALEAGYRLAAAEQAISADPPKKGQPPGAMGVSGGGLGEVPHSVIERRADANARREISRLGHRVQDDGPVTKRILKKLDEPISMAFPNEIPLKEVLKYIKSATQGPNDSAIPIYVDPEGLALAEKTMQSPVTMQLEGVPLRVTLRLLLRQLGLAYCVHDGVLIISTPQIVYEELETAQESILE